MLSRQGYAFAAGARILFGAVALALVASLFVPIAAQAKSKKSINVKVMTRNLFLGADLGPAIESDGIGESSRPTAAFFARST